MATSPPPLMDLLIIGHTNCEFELHVVSSPATPPKERKGGESGCTG